MAERKTCGSHRSHRCQENGLWRNVKKIALYILYVSVISCIFVKEIYRIILSMLIKFNGIMHYICSNPYCFLTFFESFWHVLTLQNATNSRQPAHSCPAPCALERGCSQQASGFGLSAFQRVTHKRCRFKVKSSRLAAKLIVHEHSHDQDA